METEITKKYKKRYYILTAISWAIVFGPLLGYIIYGYIVSNTITSILCGKRRSGFCAENEEFA